MSWTDLVARLRASGALAPAAQLPEPGMHWGVRLLLGIAAWIAALLVLAAILLPVVLRSLGPLQSVLGCVFLGCAGLVLRLPSPRFLRNAAVPLALAGAALFPLGLQLERYLDIQLFLIGIGLFLLSPDRQLRFLAASLALGVLWYWLLPEPGSLRYHEAGKYRAGSLAVARHLLFSWLTWLLWTSRARWPALQWPLRDAVIVVWLGGLLLTLRSDAVAAGMLTQQLWWSAILQQAVLLWAVWTVVRRQPQTFGRLWPLALLLLLAVLCPLLSAGVLLLWLGLSTHRLPLSGLGLVAMLVGCGAWYYSLALPLWHKGLLLIGIGAALLAGWARVQRSAR